MCWNLKSVTWTQSLLDGNDLHLQKVTARMNSHDVACLPRNSLLLKAGLALHNVINAGSHCSRGSNFDTSVISIGRRIPNLSEHSILQRIFRSMNRTSLYKTVLDIKQRHRYANSVKGTQSR